uniref:Ig-like domain-containing protein n=1 Tax=Trichuris muris TaxID=70415 RepID=A0A5S6Q883_TRIMR
MVWLRDLLCAILLASVAVAEPVLQVVGSVDGFRNNDVYANVGDQIGLVCIVQRSLAEPGGNVVRWVDDQGNDACEKRAQGFQSTCSRTQQGSRVTLAINATVFGPLTLTCKFVQPRYDGLNVTVKIYTRHADQADDPTVELNETSSIPIEFHCPLKRRGKSVRWFHDGSQLESSEHVNLFENGTLLIPKSSIKDCGVYLCQVANDRDYAFFQVRGKATILDKYHGSKNFMEGDNAEINCLVYGHPLPKVTWKQGDNNLTTFDSRIYAVSDRGVPNATLVLKDLRFDDRALYTCIAVNEFGSDESAVLLRVKDKLAALWPFLGILVEVVILMSIIFFFEKRRMKKEQQELQAMPEQKIPAAAPNSDKEIRQRKT